MRPNTSFAGVIFGDRMPLPKVAMRVVEMKRFNFDRAFIVSSHPEIFSFLVRENTEVVASCEEVLARLEGFSGTVVVVSDRSTCRRLDTLPLTDGFSEQYEDYKFFVGGSNDHDVATVDAVDVVNHVVVANGQSQKKSKTIVGLASYPAREKGMLAVVAALSPQCDEMYVALNEYEGEALERVLWKLSRYHNVHARAYVGEEDLGCQNKFRAVDLCGPDDYFLTVDDDISYPEDYVVTMVRYCLYFGGSSVVSCSGCVLAVSDDGSTSFSTERYFPIHDEVRQSVQVHQVGGGNTCLMPSKIGLQFGTFMFPKNSGDDEILALFCQTHGVKGFVVPHPKGWISFNRRIRSITPLSCNDSVCRIRRQCIMGIRDDWRMVGSGTRGRVLFHIVTPHYNDPELLSRCLASVASQDIDKNKIHMTVVDDCSDVEKARKAESECKKYGFVSFIGLRSRSMAGGARNAALNACVESEYTVFLDSDDMFVETSSLSTLESEIRRNGSPDVVLCGFVFDRTGSVRMFNAVTPEQMSEAQCVAPWIRVSKSGLVPRFPEGRRMSEDVVQFLRHVDSVKTVASTRITIFRYMSDNPLSGWNSSSTMRSRDAIKARFLVVSDILSESFKHDYTRKRAAIQLKSEAKCAADLVIAMRDEDLIRL